MTLILVYHLQQSRSMSTSCAKHVKYMKFWPVIRGRTKSVATTKSIASLVKCISACVTVYNNLSRRGTGAGGDRTEQSIGTIALQRYRTQCCVRSLKFFSLILIWVEVSKYDRFSMSGYFHLDQPFVQWNIYLCFKLKDSDSYLPRIVMGIVTYSVVLLSLDVLTTVFCTSVRPPGAVTCFMCSYHPNEPYDYLDPQSCEEPGVKTPTCVDEVGLCFKFIAWNATSTAIFFVCFCLAESCAALAFCTFVYYAPMWVEIEKETFIIICCQVFQGTKIFIDGTFHTSRIFRRMQRQTAALKTYKTLLGN